MCNRRISDKTNLYCIQNVRRTIAECTCGNRPGNSFTCPVVDRSQRRSNGHQRINTRYLQDAETMRIGQTARELDRPHTNALVMYINRTYLSGGVRSNFEHAQNLPTDRTGQNGYHRTQNAFGHERTENFTVCYASVSAIR